MLKKKVGIENEYIQRGVELELECIQYQKNWNWNWDDFKVSRSELELP